MFLGLDYVSQFCESAQMQFVQCRANASVGISSDFGWPLHQVGNITAASLVPVMVQIGMPYIQVGGKV